MQKKIKKKIKEFCSPVSLIVLFVDLIQLHMFRVYEVNLDLFLLHLLYKYYL